MQPSLPQPANVRIRTQQLGFGDVLSEGWRQYSGNFATILVILLVCYLPLMLSFVFYPIRTVRSSNMTVEDVGFSFVWWLLTMLLSLFAMVSILAIPKVVEDSLAGKKASAGDALRHGVRRLPSVIGSLILLFLLTMVVLFVIGILLALVALVIAALSSGLNENSRIIVGTLFTLAAFGFFALLFIPYFILAIYLGFFPFAASLRGQGPMAALQYSIALVRGQALRVFGYEIGIGILSFLVAMIVIMFAFPAGVLMAIFRV